VKKSITITLLILLVIGLCSCGTKNPMQDALTATRNTGSIEIRVYSNTDQTYTDYVITDRATVREICDTFSSSELEKVKITEPLAASYTVTFCNANGVGLESLTVVAGYNIIDYGDLYRVQDDFDVHAYVAGLVEGAEQK
jgi:hypothetical protein